MPVLMRPVPLTTIVSTGLKSVSLKCAQAKSTFACGMSDVIRVESLKLAADVNPITHA